MDKSGEMRYTGRNGGDGMFQLTGYLGGYDEDICREDTDFLVTSAGHYRLVKRPVFETVRPEGRQDYQILYVAQGSLEVRTGEEERLISEGEGVLFRPGEPQWYRYRLENGPEAYWMHFTGRGAGQLLEDAGLGGQFIRAGIRGEYLSLFDRMIRELQMKRPGFSVLCGGCGMELLALMGRQNAARPGTPADGAIEEMIARFHRDFKENIRVEDCARACNMSKSWFIRSFRVRTGVTPQRYLTDLRLTEAKELLSSSSLNIGEIAAFCGYENALYFSRIFRKYTGTSPTAYRKR